MPSCPHSLRPVAPIGRARRRGARRAPRPQPPARAPLRPGRRRAPRRRRSKPPSRAPRPAPTPAAASDSRLPPEAQRQGSTDVQSVVFIVVVLVVGLEPDDRGDLERVLVAGRELTGARPAGCTGTCPGRPPASRTSSASTGSGSARGSRTRCGRSAAARTPRSSELAVVQVRHARASKRPPKPNPGLERQVRQPRHRTSACPLSSTRRCSGRSTWLYMTEDRSRSGRGPAPRTAAGCQNSCAEAEAVLERARVSIFPVTGSMRARRAEVVVVQLPAAERVQHLDRVAAGTSRCARRGASSRGSRRRARRPAA